MLDPQKAGAALRHHFDTVTDAEFIANVKQFNPDLAQELWGDRSVAEICSARKSPARRARGFFASLGRSVLRLFS
jgi:hypothetical protein